ncbi:zinc ABC transporter substrate-binding protein [Marinobacter sp. S6332]|uniref:zinc ABC transporter substrate-binding protein n=1 Tax=Marinobacter sp. S6332 TaxID=2926403 RepID=UPI001FF21283|nr:zinc ABC transporter substrate-binding protein [Marinobacter sp. S6332]MCK0164481.1 zinc ABC transporter substrate-binding protein [Marinobacter sp. S6332]
MRIINTALSLTLGAIALLYGGTVVADTRVLASIKPLELLVRAIATEGTQTTTLVPPGASPHNYSMAPSKRRALENSDVIFWVGPDMETFLTRLLTGSEFGERSVAFIDESANTGANEDVSSIQDHEDTHHTHEDHGHDHGDGEDPHIWVDPHMALTMAETIRDTLARLGGADKQALDRNLSAFESSIAAKEVEIREQLEPMQDISLFAYHSAFTRFAEHYNLKVEGVLTLNPERSPGARHIAEVQDSLRSANHPCLLTEPQFNRQWWRSITEGLDVTFSTWDPLATDIEATADGYAAFQQSIADAVLKCLPENAQH